MRLEPETVAAIKWNDSGLVTVIVQDVNSLEVLMLAHMNETSLRRTIETGDAVYWSRSRQELWRKGETSGNTQRVIELRIDCDADALLLLVEPAGPACHTNARTCFFRSLEQFQRKPERL